MKRTPTKQAGFSLVELVMVIVIISTLSIVALSKFNRDSFQVQAAAGELVEAIRYAQEKSMTNSGAPNYQITISATDYRVTQNGVNIPNPVTGAATYQASWSGVGLAPTGTISFDGYGEPSLAGALSWAGNQEVVVVTIGAESSNVTIEQVTGFAR